jgi:hypothetical protein
MVCLCIVVDFPPASFLGFGQAAYCGQICDRNYISNILGTVRCRESPMDVLCLCDFPLLLLAAICPAWSSNRRATIQVERQTRVFYRQSIIPFGYRGGCAPVHGRASILLQSMKLVRLTNDPDCLHSPVALEHWFFDHGHFMAICVVAKSCSVTAPKTLTFLDDELSCNWHIPPTQR